MIPVFWHDPGNRSTRAMKGFICFEFDISIGSVFVLSLTNSKTSFPILAISVDGWIAFGNFSQIE